MADFSKIKAAALASIESVLSHYCPGGKRQGHEYLPLNPVRSDSKAGSFSINLNTGAWSDFATNDKGGDLIALVAYIEGVKQGEAANRLSQFLGLANEKPDAYKRATSPLNKAGDTSHHLPLKNQSGRRCCPYLITLATHRCTLNMASLQCNGLITML